MRPAGASFAGASPPLLELSNVSSRCSDGGREVAVLDGVSFEIRPGAAVGVYGARRSGKSTLLRLAAAIESPDGGEIRFDGRDVTHISAGDRARLLRGPIALLTAAGWPPSPGETVLDRLVMSVGSDGCTLREARHRALGVLEQVGVAAARAEESTASLALSERARLMLACALVREPRLLVVDEPAPLPSVGDRERFCALLRSLAGERGIALLMASEDMGALQGVDVLMSIFAGELCSTAEPATVVRLPRRHAAGRLST